MTKVGIYDPKAGTFVWQKMTKADEAEFYATDQTPVSVHRTAPAAPQAPATKPQEREE